MPNWDSWDYMGATAIRFLSHLPYVYLALSSPSLLTQVLNKPELLHPPYSPNIAPGQVIAALAACIGTAWNFFAFVPLYMCDWPSAIILGLSLLMDTTLSAAFLLAIVLQSTYLPHPLGQCGNAVHWHPKDAPSMFLVLTLPDPDDWPIGSIQTVKGKCNEFLVVWFLQIVIVFLLFIAVLINLRYCCGFCQGESPDHGSRWGPLRRPKRSFIYRLLAPRMRYRTRYADKRKDHRNSLEALDNLDSAKGTRGFFQKFFLYIPSLIGRSNVGRNGYDGLGQEIEEGASGRSETRSSTTLSSSFTQSRMLHSRTQYGTIIFPGITQNVNENHLHLESGGGECWGCGTAICNACKGTVACTSPRTNRHLNRCEPLCSDCYYREHCKDQHCEFFWHPGHCSCRDLAQPATTESRDVCQRCSKLPFDFCLVVREHREQVEMEQIAGAGLRCSNVRCKKSLSTPGPLWWRCPGCEMECLSKYHVNWQLTAKERSALSETQARGGL